MKSIAYNRRLTMLLRVCLWCLGSLPAAALGETLNVAVASNFSMTLQQIQPEFERQSGHRLQLIAGSSGRHYAQILNGAPFHLFLSADAERPAALQQGGHISPEQRRAYAIGRLVLWSRITSDSFDLQYLSQLKGDERLAIANPRLAPYGEAAVATLRALGLYPALEPRLVFGENVTQAFQFAYSGSAAFALVAYAQALAMPEVGSYVLVPDSAHAPIIQEMVLLTPDNPAAVELFEFLSSKAMIAALEQAGYYPPQLLD